MPTIEEITFGVTDLLDQRAREAQAAQRNAEREATIRAQREADEATENARIQRQTALRELTALETQQSELHATLQTKSKAWGSLRTEILELEGKFNSCLATLAGKKRALGL